jgi:cytochrome c oxidase subunit 2
MYDTHFSGTRYGSSSLKDPVAIWSMQSLDDFQSRGLSRQRLSISRRFRNCQRGLMHKGYTLVVMLFGILVSGALLNPAYATHDAPRRVEVTAMRFGFEPAEITLKKGEPVDFALKSADVPHGVRVRELDLDIKANKGTTADAHITPDKTGTFVGHCSVFCGKGHGVMTLTIHVVD